MTHAVTPQRLVILCLIPPELEPVLLKPLRRHFARDPRVRVIVDRRVENRRDRAGDDAEPAAGRLERRGHIDRRRPVLVRRLPAFPARLRKHRDAVRFVQRLVPVSASLEAASDEEIVARVRAGDPEAPTELYWRCFERMHSRLSVLLGSPARADAAVGSAFGRILDAVEADDGAHAGFEELFYAALDAAGPGGATDDDLACSVDVPQAPSLAITDPLLDEPVSVVERDPRWSRRAHGERDAVMRLAGADIVALRHVGGTAIPAMAGRPVIDLLVAVEELVPERLHSVLADRGYEDCGDAGTPGRAYYRRRGAAHFDVHVVEHGSDLWTQTIAFCEHLRENRAHAHRWAAARRQAAREGGWSLLRYAELRSPALGEILASAETSSPQPAA